MKKKYVFSYSQLQAASCSNKYHIRYTLKLKSKRYSKQRALSIGKLFHAGIEIMYKLSQRPMGMDDTISGKILQGALTHVRALSKQMRTQLVRDEEELPELFERKLDVDFGVPLIMLEAYYDFVFQNERFEIVESEKEVKVNVRTPSGRRSPNMFYLGYMDQIIRNLSGDAGLYLHEIKTAAKWDDKDEIYLKIDNQTTGYHWLAREIGLVLQGTIYTVCLKPSTGIVLLDEAKSRISKLRGVNTKIVNAKKKALDAGEKYDGPERIDIPNYHPIDDYETADQYLARVKKDYLENPSRYFIRKIFTRSAEQLKRFEVELYHSCQDAKNIREKDNFMQPNKMTCPNCDGYDLCRDWTEDTMRRWYEAKDKGDKSDIRSIVLE